MSERPSLYLIDGNSFVYRAFHAIRGLSNSKGLPTNAVYGFTNMLLKLIKEQTPSGIAVCFDSPAPTKRHRLYEEYKAQRPETPSDLIVQIPYIREILKALGIKIYEMEGFEADDLLAVLAVRASESGYDVYLVTGDKDMFQIVDEHIFIYDPMKNRLYKRDDVIKKFGLPPERIPELMALTGDSIDNIPGAKGIGQKTALSLLKEFSLGELIEEPERVQKKRLSGIIKNSLDDIRMSYELALIDRKAPVEFNPQDVKPSEPDWQRLLELFRELEFNKLLDMIPSEKTEVECRVVTDEKELKDCVSSPVKEIVLFGVIQDSSSLVGLSMKTRKDILYLPCGHRYLGMPGQLKQQSIMEHLSGLLDDSTVKKTGHDLKRLMKALNRSFRGELQDVMIASYLLNPNRSEHSLDVLCLEHLKKKTDIEKELYTGDVSVKDVETVGEFSALAVSVIEELREKLFRALKKEGLQEVYYSIEMPLIEVLFEMERTGVRVDEEVLSGLSGELETELMEIKRRIYSISGEEFNINSPKQLSYILFEKIGLKPIKRTKTGYSTDMRVLEELAREHELPREILNWRSLSKLKSTYVDALPRLINPKTGRIHTTFNQTVTATGRLSSSDPNLQNIPVRGEWGRKIRAAFVAEEGYRLLSADYSQIELRVLAHLSRDEKLISAFRSGKDIHTATAVDLFEVSPDEVTADMRRIAKTVNFGVIYGISAYGLSEAIEVSMEDAQSYIDEYFLKYPGVRQYYDRTIQEARRLGYVKTLFGRKRPVPELLSPSSQRNAFGQRLAMNSPVQGTAADIIKLAMINIHRRLKEERLDCRMILQVHDELVFEVKAGEVERVKELVKAEMEGVVSLEVPLVVEVGVGSNWAEAH